MRRLKLFRSISNPRENKCANDLNFIDSSDSTDSITLSRWQERIRETYLSLHFLTTKVVNRSGRVKRGSIEKNSWRLSRRYRRQMSLFFEGESVVENSTFKEKKSEGEEKGCDAPGPRHRCFLRRHRFPCCRTESILRHKNETFKNHPMPREI